MSDATANHLLQLDREFRPYAAHLIDAVRDAGIPLVIISSRRSPAINEDVGGAAASLHLYGLAIDVRVRGYHRNQVPFWFWQLVGEYWEGMGGRWGGRFRSLDVNHFDVGVVEV